MSEVVEKTILLTIREAAKSCRKLELREQLKTTADELAEALRKLWNAPTETNMRHVTGLWGLGLRLVKAVDATDPPSGSGGALQVGARLAA